MMQSSDLSARSAIIKPLTQPKQDEIRACKANGDQAGSNKAVRELYALNQAAGIQMWKLGLPFLQIPVGFALWRVTRNMADLPVPGLSDGGILWFTDLTHMDPLFILPIAVALMQHLSVRVC